MQQVVQAGGAGALGGYRQLLGRNETGQPMRTPGGEGDPDGEIVLLVVPMPGVMLDEPLKERIRTQIATQVSPHHLPDRILAAVKAKGVTLEKILVTHGHIDHAGAVAELAERHNDLSMDFAMMDEPTA